MSQPSELPGRRFAHANVDASHQIAQQLRYYLEEKGLRPGDRIGTEQELAAEFGVSRPTLREGLRLPCVPATMRHDDFALHRQTSQPEPARCTRAVHDCAA